MLFEPGSAHGGVERRPASGSTAQRIGQRHGYSSAVTEGR